ncbi:hypothetical protein GGI15_000185 [Coemansia interrupta]|uniref:RING-type domain-containing protein n=1 Tax=Coemansia interrupta TaxID=1126814 RepID=A0A9W8LQ45_9FUNG|nr:hypothetical protein GGI15_000185 [Coemansia interrupta]
MPHTTELCTILHPLKVIVMATFAYIQIIVGLIVLPLSAHKNEVTKQPLQVYIILYITRLFVYYPLYINCKVHRFGLSWPNPRAAAHLKTVRRFLELYGLVLFIVGNYWTFADKESRETAPLLHQTSVAYIVLGYLYLAFPVGIVTLLSIIFCILFVFVPSFRMKYTKKKGADFSQISQIPLVRYIDPLLRLQTTSVSSPPSLHGHDHAHDDHPTFSPPSCPAAAQSSTSLHSTTGTARHRHGISHIHLLSPFVRIAHRLTRSRRQRAAEMELYKKQLSNPVGDFTPEDPEDRMCAICLSEYEDGEVLRLLPCKHHMHQACVDEWLHINKSCPLCKREAIETSSDTAESDANAVSDSNETENNPDHETTDLSCTLQAPEGAQADMTAPAALQQATTATA